MVNKLFHYLSYFRFVLIIWGCCYAYPEIFFPTENMASNIGMGMLLCGLGMSFEGLKDDRIAGKIDGKIYKNEKLTKTLLVVWSVMFFLIILFSFFIIFGIDQKQLGYGILTFGVGGITLMKSEYCKFNLHRVKVPRKADIPF